MTTSQSPDMAFVNQTRRHAVKLGDEYLTLEGTVQLPPGATDEQITQAAQTCVKINAALETAFAPLIEALRQQAQTLNTDEPASQKQRAYLDYLQKELNWDVDRLVVYVTEQGYDLDNLLKSEASEVIDGLKNLVNGTPSQPVAAQPTFRADIPQDQRATQRQVNAMERAAAEGRLDVDGVLRRYAVRQLTFLSMDEAGQVLATCQPAKAAAPQQAAPTRQPDPQRLQTARTALAGAEQRTQVRPATGQCPVPQGPVPTVHGASPGQIGKIAGQMHELRQAGMSDADLDEIGIQFDIPNLSQLRKSEQLHGLGLTKADAGQVIDALKAALAEFGIVTA